MQNRIYMPHAAHWILRQRCQFFLATYLPNDFIVSTVGECVSPKPGEHIEEALRRCIIEGFETIGGSGPGDRKMYYETMVFGAIQRPGEKTCCPWMIDGPEQECLRASTAVEAVKNHEAFCRIFENKNQYCPLDEAPW
jgi:hypothetical protein